MEPKVKVIDFVKIDKKAIYKELKKKSKEAMFFTVNKNKKYTLIPYKPKRLLSAYTNQVKLSNRSERSLGNAIKTIEETIKSLDDYYNSLSKKTKNKLPSFFAGGIFGFFGFNAHFLKNQKGLSKDIKKFHKKNSLALLFKIEDFILLDWSLKKIMLVSNPLTENTPKKNPAKTIKEMEAIIRKARKYNDAKKPVPSCKQQVKANNQRLLESIRYAKKFVDKGKINQVNISLRTTVESVTPLINIYETQAKKCPTTYLFLFETKEAAFVGASPEVLFESKQGKATVKPISGSYPRGASIKEDREIKNQLLLDKKERKEHDQIVAAVASDLKKVCEKNSVQTVKKRQILKMQYVQHIQSKVQGKIRKEKSVVDAFFANFPPIAITGVPRRQALQAIEQVESTPRFLYGGGIGFFDGNKNCDFGILIRCFQKTGKNKLELRVGSKISKGSKPVSEMHEIVSKTNSLITILKE